MLALRSKFPFKRRALCRILDQIRTYQIAMHRPRRALLYVPGDNERHITKVIKIINSNENNRSQKPDCVVFDCEDGVAMNRKEAARLQIKNVFSGNSELCSNIDWSVRLNSVQSDYFEEDLKVICSAERMPETLLLPKVECTEDLDKFSNIFHKNLQDNGKSNVINLIFYAESCKGIMNLNEICSHAIKLSPKINISGIIFGSDDFLSDLGAVRNPEDSTNILYARQRVVLIAKAFKLQAIDMVFINFKDLKGLKNQAIEGSNLGYTGKQVIHPQQVETVQNAFMPTDEKVKWAEGILGAYKEHQKIGKGAFVYRNQMIDNPTVNQAANILKLIELNKKSYNS